MQMARAPQSFWTTLFHGQILRVRISSMHLDRAFSYNNTWFDGIERLHFTALEAASLVGLLFMVGSLGPALFDLVLVSARCCFFLFLIHHFCALSLTRSRTSSSRVFSPLV